MSSCFPFFRKTEEVVSFSVYRNDCQLLNRRQLKGNWPQRVALIESGQNSGRYDENGLMITELANQFRSRNFFDVVSPCDQRLFGNPDNLVRGKFEEREVVAISRQYNADTLAIVRVNELRAQQPMRVSVTVAFIDSAETITSAAVTGVWDLANSQTAAAFESFVFEKGNTAVNLAISKEALEIQLRSPQNLLRFVADDIAQAMV